jgi:hypothetical protein
MDSSDNLFATFAADRRKAALRPRRFTRAFSAVVAEIVDHAALVLIMKRLLPLTALLLGCFGCAHTGSTSHREAWHTLQIQSPAHATMSPAFLVEVAREYLRTQQIAVVPAPPILDICVSTQDRIAIVKFWRSGGQLVAVVIGPDGTVSRHQEIGLAK